VSDVIRARREMAKWGYVTPVVSRHLGSPLASLVSGACVMLDPFRSSLPSIYQQLPPAWADVIALRSDWDMYGGDFGFVRQHELVAANERQESLFDPNDLEP
jgi:hypothetical protein